MQPLQAAWQYVLSNQPEFLSKTSLHLRLSASALVAGIVLGIVLGVFAARWQSGSPLITNIVGALRAIPSLAIMALMLPLIGIGFVPALVALTILAIPPVLINTVAGFANVDPAILEAGRGMGMTGTQIAWLVQAPLALPVIVAGIRTATVEVLASATIGAIIGAGGLGEYVFAGLSLGPAYIHLMLVGAITIAIMTLAADIALSTLERLLQRRLTH